MVLMPMRLDGGVVKPELIILYLGRQTATHHAGVVNTQLDTLSL